MLSALAHRRSPRVTKCYIGARASKKRPREERSTRAKKLPRRRAVLVLLLSLMPLTPDNQPARQLHILLLGICAYITNSVYLAIYLYSSPHYWKQPYHTSALSGNAWVQELLHGHPDHIRNELGMRLHAFLAFVGELRQNGLNDTRYITVEEKAAIFLYMCVTGLKIRHVGERFQHANETISK